MDRHYVSMDMKICEKGEIEKFEMSGSVVVVEKMRADRCEGIMK